VCFLRGVNWWRSRICGYGTGLGSPTSVTQNFELSLLDFFLEFDHHCVLLLTVSSKILKNSVREGKTWRKRRKAWALQTFSDLVWPPSRVICVIASHTGRWVASEPSAMVLLCLSVCALSRDCVGLWFSTLLCIFVRVYHVTVPVSLCLSRDYACRSVFITWLCLSACALACVSVGLYLSRNCTFGLCFITWLCLSVFITWLCLSACALSSDRACLCLPRDCVCQPVLYHVIVPVCVYHVSVSVSHCFITWLWQSVCAFSRGRAFRSLFITWLCLSVCALSCDCVCRSVLIAWLSSLFVFYHVTALVGLCFITWPCLSVCALLLQLCRPVYV